MIQGQVFGSLEEDPPKFCWIFSLHKQAMNISLMEPLSGTWLLFVSYIELTSTALPMMSNLMILRIFWKGSLFSMITFCSFPFSFTFSFLFLFYSSRRKLHFCNLQGEITSSQYIRSIHNLLHLVKYIWVPTGILSRIVILSTSFL